MNKPRLSAEWKRRLGDLAWFVIVFELSLALYEVPRIIALIGVIADDTTDSLGDGAPALTALVGLFGSLLTPWPLIGAVLIGAAVIAVQVKTSTPWFITWFVAVSLGALMGPAWALLVFALTGDEPYSVLGGFFMLAQGAWCAAIAVPALRLRQALSRGRAPDAAAA